MIALSALAAGERVCGREVVRVLPGGRSVLCRDAGRGGERRVVIKALPRDCVVRGKTGASELHAHVRERLLRVRELADPSVAALHGVEEDERLGPMLVWDYVPGEDLSTLPPGEGSGGGGGVMARARAVVTAVERLHLLGIVHGALHLRNVIVGEGGAVSLTHISPLVIDDPRHDAADLLKLLRELNARELDARELGARERRPVGAENAVLARVIAECSPDPDVGRVRERLLTAEGARFVQGREVRRGMSPGVRSLWAAVGIASAGLGASALLGWWVSGR